MPSIQLGDMNLFYQEKGTGHEAILALHPSTVNGTMFTWAIPRHEQYRVILPDQRGHGKTPNPAPDFKLARFIQDAIDMMDALEIEQFHAMGYSLGGAVILGLCERIPHRLRDIVIIGSSHVSPSEAQQTAIAGDPATRQGLVRDIMHPERGLRGGGWQFDTTNFAQITGRVGIITGDRDPVVPLTATTELYGLFPNAELLVVPDCGHFGYHTSPLVKSYLQTFWGEA